MILCDEFFLGEVWKGREKILKLSAPQDIFGFACNFSQGKSLPSHIDTISKGYLFLTIFKNWNLHNIPTLSLTEGLPSASF